MLSSLRLSLIVLGNHKSILFSGASHENYQALWFERVEDRITGEQVHIYKGGYWEMKDRGNWEGCPDIF